MNCSQVHFFEFFPSGHLRLLHHPAVRWDVRRLQLESCLNHAGGLLWCPKPGCNQSMIRLPDSEFIACSRAANSVWQACKALFKSVSSTEGRFDPDRFFCCPSCGTELCKCCGRSSRSSRTPWNSHYNLSCEEFGQLIGTMNSMNQLPESVRFCPGCRMNIEKNGGCIHMTCPCSHQFCWECGESWKTHQYEACKPRKWWRDEKPEPPPPPNARKSLLRHVGHRSIDKLVDNLSSGNLLEAIPRFSE